MDRGKVWPRASDCLYTRHSPATHQDRAHAEDHRSDPVVEFEAPVVDGDLVRGHHRRDDPGEGADEDVRH